MGRGVRTGFLRLAVVTTCLGFSISQRTVISHLIEDCLEHREELCRAGIGVSLQSHYC